MSKRLHDDDSSNSSKKQKQENDSIDPLVPPFLPVVQLISSSCEEDNEGWWWNRNIKGTFETGPKKATFSVEFDEVCTDCGGAEAAISSELFGLYSMYCNGLRSEGEDGWGGEEGHYLSSCITKPGLYFSDANILAFLKEAGLENFQSPNCIEGKSIHENRKWVYGDIMSTAIQMFIDKETDGKPIQTQNQNFMPSDIYVWLGVQDSDAVAWQKEYQRNKAIETLQKYFLPVVLHQLYKPDGIRMRKVSETTLVGK